ncbi:MAG: class I SAM-dependent methyltransferase family protein [Nanoarchaeota archaeon]
MLAAQAELKNAEKVKQFLLHHKLLHPDYLLVKEFNFIYFPVIKAAKVPQAKVLNTRFSFPSKKKNPLPEDFLKEKLTAKELALLPHSQEAVGKILILEIPLDLRKKERIIAEAYLKSNRQIETVVRKEQIHEGEYRLRKVRVLAGKNTKETIHKESGVLLKLHLEQAYFSARLAEERLRIAKQIQPGEEVLVMFSGAGPYLCVLGRHSQARKIYGIELNPLAHQYALENVKLNNLQWKVMLYEGNVRKIVPQLGKLRKSGKTFDRIVMPLPKTGELFLDVALKAAKKGTIIHFYTFCREEEIRKEGERIKQLCTQWKRPVNILRSVQCGQSAPYVFRVCFDLKTIN